MRTPPSQPHHLLKSFLLPNTIPLQVRISTDTFQKKANILTTALWEVAHEKIISSIQNNAWFMHTQLNGGCMRLYPLCANFLTGKQRSKQTVTILSSFRRELKYRSLSHMKLSTFDCFWLVQIIIWGRTIWSSGYMLIPTYRVSGSIRNMNYGCILPSLSSSAVKRTSETQQDWNCVAFFFLSLFHFLFCTPTPPRLIIIFPGTL